VVKGRTATLLVLQGSATKCCRPRRGITSIEAAAQCVRRSIRDRTSRTCRWWLSCCGQQSPSVACL